MAVPNEGYESKEGNAQDQPIPRIVLEGTREAIARLAAAFPATPTIDSPDSGTIWPIRSGTGIVVVLVNKPSVRYVLSVRDLTAGVDVPAPACPPPPVPSPFTLSVSGLTSGHDYRIRIAVDAADALPGDMPHAVYVTAI
jgi:hypothetical protein